jgi:NodT family efflux transporter outer membrane factor (OMF) lipoprotein
MAVAAPQQWSAGELPDGPPQSQWWAYFGDAGLDKAISTTLTHNKNLAAAAARIDAAEAQARIAGAAALPDLNAGFSRTRQHINFVGFPIPGAGDRILSSTSTQLGLSLNLSWEADVWGLVKAGRIAALSDLQAVEADLAGVQLSLTGQATKAWFAAIEAKRQVSLAKASLESYEVSSRRVRARFNSGIRPSLDLRLALTEVSRAASLLQQRRQQLDATLRQLEILMGRYPAAEYALAEDLPNTPRGLPAGLPSELVHRRPDLAAAERRLLGADARIAQAKTDLRPRFNLTASSGTTTNKLRQVLSGDVFVWSLIGGLTQPIFNNGRLKATVKQSEAMAREAAANYEDAILRAYGEVETALAADAHLEGQQQALEEATRLAMAAQGLAEQRYRSGLADITTMLQAQRTALDAESSLLSIRRARLDNRVDLHLALGGDFTMTAPSRVASGPESRKTL